MQILQLLGIKRKQALQRVQILHFEGEWDVSYLKKKRIKRLKNWSFNKINYYYYYYWKFFFFFRMGERGFTVLNVRNVSSPRTNIATRVKDVVWMITCAENFNLMKIVIIVICPDIKKTNVLVWMKTNSKGKVKSKSGNCE